MAKIKVLNQEIAVYSHDDADYICLTDMARYKDIERTDYIIQNWLRNRNTIEFLGIWEQLNNPGFKPIEFDGFRRRGTEILERRRSIDIWADGRLRAYRYTKPGKGLKALGALRIPHPP